jgi:hypothetical protein
MQFTIETGGSPIIIDLEKDVDIDMENLDIELKNCARRYAYYGLLCAHFENEERKFTNELANFASTPGIDPLRIQKLVVQQNRARKYKSQLNIAKKSMELKNAALIGLLKKQTGKEDMKKEPIKKITKKEKHNEL